MKQQNNKSVSVVGIIVVVAIIVAIVCGLLECFGISTGVIGGVFAIIPAVCVVGFVAWQVIVEVKK